MPAVPEGRQPGTERPYLTVVVMGYRNESTIEEAVESVITQEAPVPFEVVVVTSGGDGSGDRVHRSFPDLRMTESPVRLLPGGARNAGLDLARGRVAAFLAADCVAEPGWVAARARAHQEGYGGVAGAVTNAGASRPAALASLFLNYRRRLPTASRREVAWPDPAAHSLSFVIDLFDQVGRFDDELLIGEDTSMARRLTEHGVPILFEPDVRTAHHGPSGLRELIRDQVRRGARFVEVNQTEDPGQGNKGKRLARETARLGQIISHAVRMAFGSRAWWIVRSLPWIVVGDVALRWGRWRAFNARG